MARWEYFEHAADVGVRGIGRTPAEAFVQAALALFSLVSEDLPAVRLEKEEKLVLGADTLEDLFFAYLSELVSLSDARRMVFGQVDLEIRTVPGGRWRLEGTAHGESYDPARHESTVEPKGATYTALEVKEENGEWIAQCVVDV